MESKDETRKTTDHATVVENNNWMSGRQEIHQIERREIWIQQAAIFIKQVYVIMYITR
jgi:hypothetical protein